MSTEDIIFGSQTREAYKDSVIQSFETLRKKPFSLLFPGQGNLRLGMGKRLLAAFNNDSNLIALYKVANVIYHDINPEDSISLSQHIFTEDGESLKTARVSQPSLALTTLALNYLLQNRFHIYPIVAAGHSAGEYPALATIGTLSPEDVLWIMANRGRIAENEIAKARARGEPPTGMLSLFSKTENGVLHKRVFDILKEFGIEIRDSNGGFALINSPQSVVLWLHEELLQQALKLKKELAKRGILEMQLAIPSAFHSPLQSMLETQEQMKEVLHKVTWNQPQIPIILNQTGAPTMDINTIINALLENHTHLVNWITTMSNITTPRTVETGPGKSLTSFIQTSRKDEIEAVTFDSLI